jgi:hypothetical protein
MLNYYDYCRKQEVFKDERKKYLENKRLSKLHKKSIKQLSDNYRKRIDKFIEMVHYSRGC